MNKAQFVTLQEYLICKKDGTLLRIH